MPDPRSNPSILPFAESVLDYILGPRVLVSADEVASNRVEVRLVNRSSKAVWLRRFIIETHQGKLIFESYRGLPAQLQSDASHSEPIDLKALDRVLHQKNIQGPSRIVAGFEDEIGNRYTTKLKSKRN